MKPFPRDRSILIMDNSAIHKSQAVREIIQAMGKPIFPRYTLFSYNSEGCSIVFLPPYSPDLNPIEESFRAVKAWLRRHWRRRGMESDEPELMLYEATATVTPEKSQRWIAQSGYIIESLAVERFT
jgi:transposase